MVFSSYTIIQGIHEQSFSSEELIQPEMGLSSSAVNVTTQGGYYYLTNEFLELRIKTDNAEQRLISLADSTIYYEGASSGHTIEINHADNSYSGVYYDIFNYGSAKLSFWGYNGII